MPKTTNLKKDDEKRIKALYEVGATQRELAKIYGVGLTKINDICKGADREQTQELINQGVNFNVASVRLTFGLRSNALKCELCPSP